MQDIANDLGVTESRVSQMRAEALVLLRAGLESALDTDNAPAAEEPKGRAAKRTAAYMAEVAAASNYKMRISADAPSVPERVAVNACGPDGEIIAELPNSAGTAPIHTRTEEHTFETKSIMRLTSHVLSFKKQ